MNKVPISSRKHVALIGNVNSGKSSLFNALLGQDLAIVSEIEGTTTDPVIKAMELIPYGPIALIDTAGLGDNGPIGAKRIEKTDKVSKRADLFILVTDCSDAQDTEFKKSPSIRVFTKCDKSDKSVLDALKKKYSDAVFVSNNDTDSISKLKQRISEELKKLDTESNTLIGDLLPKGSTLILVVPIDNEAPSGRLILPQVQLIRDCLDYNMKVFICRETELSSAISEINRVDLVVTDSQIFKTVDKIVPRGIPLTSFSILLARHNGNFGQLLNGVYSIKNLPVNSKILILEGCTHNHTHEDIGHVKIPEMLNVNTGKSFNYTFASGYDTPENIDEYDLIIQCGSCMLNKAFITDRLNEYQKNGIPVTNYGLVLAYLSGILERAIKIFDCMQK